MKRRPAHADRILALLRSHPDGLTIPQMAEILDVHANTIWYTPLTLANVYLADWIQRERRCGGKSKPSALWKLWTEEGQPPPDKVPPWIERARKPYQPIKRPCTSGAPTGRSSEPTPPSPPGPYALSGVVNQWLRSDTPTETQP